MIWKIFGWCWILVALVALGFTVWDTAVFILEQRAREGKD